MEKTMPVDRRRASLQEITWRLGELEHLVSCVTGLSTVFAQVGEKVRAKGWCTLRGRIAQTAQDDLFERLGKIRTKTAWRKWFVCDDSRADRCERAALKRTSIRHQFEKHDPNRPDIGARIDRSRTSHLLWSHVLRRTQNGRGSGEPLRNLRFDGV